MTKTLLILNLFVVSTLFSSCALNKVVKARKIKTPDEVMADVSDKLRALVVEAKKSGPDKVDFLSGDLFLKANSAAIQNDHHTANLIYENLTLLVEDDFINKKYAISLIRTGELKKSKAILSKVFKNSNELDSRTGLLLAGVYSSLGKVNESQNVYRRLLSKNSKNEEACVFLGKSYALQEKVKKAVKTLASCEKNIKDRGIFSYYIGKIYVDKGDLDTAQKYFKKSIKAEPSFSQSTMALGVVYEEQKKNKKALLVYKNFLKKYPDDALILNRIVQLHFSQEQFQKVIPYAERLSDFEPDNLNLKVKLGILYTDAGRYDVAISTFKNLLKEVPKNDKILYYLGAIYQEKKEFESAVEYFTLIPPESGLYQDSSIQVAQMLSSLAQVNKTIAKHNRFVNFVDGKIKESNPFQVEFSVIKASYLESKKLFQVSVETLEKVSSLENFGDNHKYYLASLYEKVGDFKRSEGLVLEIVKKDPKNAHAWNFLGYSLLERGLDMDKAFKYISRAAELEPKDGFIRDSLGWYYFQIGNTEKALDELLLAIKAQPKDVSIQKHLAIVYSSMKDFKTAKKHIVEAIKYSSIESEREELGRVLRSIESKRVPASFK